MTQERIHLPNGMSVETGIDKNGRFFITYGKSGTTYGRCPKQLLTLLSRALPQTSQASLESWLQSLGTGK